MSIDATTAAPIAPTDQNSSAPTSAPAGSGGIVTSAAPAADAMAQAGAGLGPLTPAPQVIAAPPEPKSRVHAILDAVSGALGAQKTDAQGNTRSTESRVGSGVGNALAIAGSALSARRPEMAHNYEQDIQNQRVKQQEIAQHQQELDQQNLLTRATIAHMAHTDINAGKQLDLASNEFKQRVTEYDNTSQSQYQQWGWKPVQMIADGKDVNGTSDHNAQYQWMAQHVTPPKGFDYVPSRQTAPDGTQTYTVFLAPHDTMKQPVTLTPKEFEAQTGQKTNSDVTITRQGLFALKQDYMGNLVKQQQIETSKAEAKEHAAGAAQKQAEANQTNMFTPSGGGGGNAGPGVSHGPAQSSGPGQYSNDPNDADFVDQNFIKTLNPSAQSTVMGIINGTVTAPPEMQRGKVSPLFQAVERATNGHYDAAKYNAYNKQLISMTSGPIGDKLNRGNTALGHLNELMQLNTNESHIPHTNDWTKYQNKVDTVASELAAFYGDTTIPAIQHIKETLNSTLPGNREAAIKTQASSMHDRFNSYQKQLDDARPNNFMRMKKIMSPEGESAYNSIVNGGKPPALPQGATHIVPGPDGKNHYTNATGTVDLGVAP
jgi:hypothetical protein